MRGDDERKLARGAGGSCGHRCLHLGCSGTRRDGERHRGGGTRPTRLDGQNLVPQSPASPGDGCPDPAGSCKALKKLLLLGPRCPRVSQPLRALGGSKDAAGGKAVAEPHGGKKVREPFL